MSSAPLALVLALLLALLPDCRASCGLHCTVCQSALRGPVPVDGGMEYYLAWPAKLSVCVGFKAAYSEWRGLVHALAHPSVSLRGDVVVDARGRPFRQHMEYSGGFEPRLKKRVGSGGFMGDHLHNGWAEFYASTPEWHHVLAVRDPLERLYSGYLDKCVANRPGTSEHRKNCLMRGSLRCTDPSATPEFAEFVHGLRSLWALPKAHPHSLRHPKSNGHFCLQSSACGGFRNHSAVLRWQSHGVNGSRSLQKQGRALCTLLRRPVAICEYFFAKARAGSATSRHRTSAAVWNLRHSYFFNDSNVLREAMEIYGDDYAALGIPRPDWLGS